MNKIIFSLFLLSTSSFLTSMSLYNNPACALANDGNFEELMKCLKESAGGIFMHSPLAEQPNHYDETPLYLAAKAGHANCVNLLLKYGANTLIVPNSNKVSPLHIASWKGHLECVKALIRGGSMLDWGDEEDNTPLHITCERNYPKIVALLLKYRANPMKKNKAGLTPLQTACKANSKECVVLLENYFTT